MGGRGGRHCTPFQYYILVDEMELGGGLSCESYGVKVAGPDGEEASVPNITVSVERIDQLLSSSGATASPRHPAGRGS